MFFFERNRSKLFVYTKGMSQVYSRIEKGIFEAYECYMKLYPQIMVMSVLRCIRWFFKGPICNAYVYVYLYNKETCVYFQWNGISKACSRYPKGI